MESLETARDKLNQLSSDLHAVIVIQPQLGHFEKEKETYVPFSGGDYTERVLYAEERWVSHWVVDKEAVTRQDTEKQEKASESLQILRNAFEWYTVRYWAERALRTTSTELDNLVGSWVEEMRQRLDDPREERSAKLQVLEDANELHQQSKDKRVLDLLKDCYKRNHDRKVRAKAAWYFMPRERQVCIDLNNHFPMSRVLENRMRIMFNDLRTVTHRHPITAIILGILVATILVLGLMAFRFF